MLYAAIHLLGSIVAYLTTRYWQIKYHGGWTVGGRKIYGIGCLVMSWIALVSTLICLGIEQSMNGENDAPAKW